jgi:polysaccharide biosynthesis/export protein
MPGVSLFQSAAKVALLVGACSSAPACASSGRYQWYTQVPKTEWGGNPQTYTIAPGDVLSFKVYEQDPLGGTAKVRNDGRLAVPLVGELVAAGKTPAAFAEELETRLKRFIVTPRVTVNVEQSQPITVSALGEVKTPGELALDPPPRLLQALAKAGGMTEFADDTRIFVLRQYPTFRRIRFTYHALVNDEGGAANFVLRNGDVVVVE